MSRLSNRRQKDRKKRKRLREALEAKGVPEERIEEIIAQRRREDRQARHSPRQQTYEYDPQQDEGYYPDDSRYRPDAGDPLLRGVGRPTGMAARVVQRPETITDWQYDRLIGKDTERD